MTKFSVFALLLALLLPTVCTAAPRTLSWNQLTEGSLLGQVRSTAELQRDFLTQKTLLASASSRLGLSRDDFDTLQREIELGHVRYVTVPRHLDGMAGANAGVPFVDRDIIIPAGVHGWEVDLQKRYVTIHVFLPNTCGNISILSGPRPYRVAAARYPVPTPAPAAPQLAFTPTPAPIVTPTPSAVATAVPVAVASAMPAAAPSRHLGWLAALVVPLILGFSGGGHSGSASAPTPIHTICPTAAIRIR
jgi:hypothetical protein